ncbi:MAG: hypothetical protein ACLQFW_15920 [Xanthobacteraceae bacterium]
MTATELADQLFLIENFMPCDAAEKRRRSEALLGTVSTRTAMEALEILEQKRRREEN